MKSWRARFRRGSAQQQSDLILGLLDLAVEAGSLLRRIHQLLGLAQIEQRCNTACLTADRKVQESCRVASVAFEISNS